MALQLCMIPKQGVSTEAALAFLKTAAQSKNGPLSEMKFEEHGTAITACLDGVTSLAQLHEIHRIVSMVAT